MAKYTVVEYQFGPGQTIEAAIKLVNHQSMSRPLLNKLVEDFVKINGNGVPRLGQTVYIPVFVGFIGENKKFETMVVDV